MALYEKLDFWSIDKKLDRIMEYGIYNKSDRNEYYYAYEDGVNEIRNLAATIYERFYHIKITLTEKMPWKNVDFYDEDNSQSGVAWFNTIASLLDDCDMTILLENEECYEADEEHEKNKRLKAINKLTKQQMLLSFTIVNNFIFDYLKLESSFDTLVAIIAELEENNSFLTKKGEIVMLDTVWVM